MYHPSIYSSEIQNKLVKNNVPMFDRKCPIACMQPQCNARSWFIFFQEILRYSTGITDSWKWKYTLPVFSSLDGQCIFVFIPTKLGVKFPSSFRSSPFDWQLRNELLEFKANLWNSQQTSQIACQKFCEMHCNNTWLITNKKIRFVFLRDDSYNIIVIIFNGSTMHFHSEWMIVMIELEFGIFIAITSFSTLCHAKWCNFVTPKMPKK